VPHEKIEIALLRTTLRSVGAAKTRMATRADMGVSIARQQSKKAELKMRLGKIEYASLAVALLSVVCFAQWLQNAMDRAGQTRERLEVEDAGGSCPGATTTGLALNDVGTIWCGVIRRAPANRQEKSGA
jgi:hypothetical protein